MFVGLVSVYVGGGGSLAHAVAGRVLAGDAVECG
jgi:hypothetical protein